ncbi:MAG: 30S ribosomal protein S8 [Candidatus Altiarchaeales archaeon HGW-Altiarchaeales-3]|nr:MAG: 30S ribosomal protein S8 [Candidatus Altiarchaeales archaeon HGW-Altiarchaeales-3]
MMHDPINDAISNIKNHERAGKSTCTVKPTSKVLINILRVFQKEGYIGEFELEDDNRGSVITVNLLKKINHCGVIKPRFPVKHNEFIKWEKQFLPARDFGILIVSTPKGVMTHNEAKENSIGGRLLAYVY